MKMDEKWIRSHLPQELAGQPIDFFRCQYLDGLTVMQEGERGGDDVVVYRAKDEEDLKYWQLEHVCRFIKEPDPPARKTWRYYRHHAEDGKWFYTEHRNYDYNASDILPPPMLTHRGGGFSLNNCNQLSINELSPCAPRFYFGATPT